MANVFVAIVFWIIHWTVILPAALVVATPYILIASLFRSAPYPSAVGCYYGDIYASFAKFWREIGLHFTP